MYRKNLKIMRKYNWQSYNSKSNKLSKKIINFNKINKFNFIEKNIYTHIRDIFCLVLALSKKGNKINVLDYGSNILSLSNIKNKIVTGKFNFFIFDPYKNNNTKEIKPFKITILNNKKDLNKYKYDILNFGSCLQYTETLKNLDKHLNFSNISKIIITHTPFTLGKSFSAIQSNHSNLVQNIHNYNSLINFFKKKKFNFIFKSKNDDRFIGLKNTNKKVFSLNIVLSK